MAFGLVNLCGSMVFSNEVSDLVSNLFTNVQPDLILMLMLVCGGLAMLGGVFLWLNRRLDVFTDTVKGQYGQAFVDSRDWPSFMKGVNARVAQILEINNPNTLPS